jgi:hypothetical protein
MSRDLPACGLQIQRAPASDLRWKNNVRAARYRGQLMANRIRKHGKLSPEARAKINEELAYFEGDAKEAYLREVQPILKATVEIEMPEERIVKKVPPPPQVTWSLLPTEPRWKSDEEIYAPLIEAKRKEAEEQEAERQGELEKLRELTKGWGTDQEFALALLEPILKVTLHPDPRGVAAAIRKQILARYEIWLRAEDKRRLAVCGKMPGGAMGFILKQQAKWHPTLDPCRSWFQDEYSHGPQELLDLERMLKIRGTGADAMNTVYWSVREYRYKTDPMDLKQAEMAGEMVSGLAGLGRMPGEPAVGGPAPEPSAGGTPADVPPPVSPPVRGFQPPNAPPPAPVPAKVPRALHEPPIVTQMPPARKMPFSPSQAGQPQVGSVAPAVSGEKQGQPTVAMAGKRRVGVEHESNIRPSTEEEHQVARGRAQREQEAADLRNALTRQEALQSRVRQFVSKLERIIKNLKPRTGLLRQLKTEGIRVEERYQALLKELSAVEREEMETLRTQLRRELGISGAELDDFVIDELDRLGLLPRGLPEE